MKKNEEIASGIQKIEGLIIRKNGSRYFSDFRFLVGARSKDETRYFMTGIHVEHINGNTVAITTDGRRLHIARWEGTEIDEGDYQIKDNSRDFFILYPHDDDLQYPNWQRVIPRDSKKHFSMDMAPKVGRDNGTYSREIAQLYKTTGAVLNMDYVDALRGRKWDVHFDDPKHAITFTSDNLLAVIMPMQEAEEITVDESVGPDFRDITPKIKILEFKPATTKKIRKRKIA